MDARVRASQRGRQHWSAAFPRLKAWILSRPVSASSSGPTSEISSQAGEVDFEDNLLVSTPSLLVQQVLVVQAQNGVNMASGTATTAPCTATAAPSTAPLPLAEPSTMEPIVPIRAQLGAQDRPSVIQGAQDTPSVNQARPAISTLYRADNAVYSEVRHPAVRFWPAVYSTPAIYGTPAVRCHACYVSKVFLPNGLLWSGQSVPFYA